MNVWACYSIVRPSSLGAPAPSVQGATASAVYQRSSSHGAASGERSAFLLRGGSEKTPQPGLDDAFRDVEELERSLERHA